MDLPTHDYLTQAASNINNIKMNVITYQDMIDIISMFSSQNF